MSINIKHLILCLVTGWSMLLLTACDAEAPPLRLTSRERVQIDTLYTNQVEILKPQWDSICETSYDSLLNSAVDSIIKVRREEEYRLRERLKQQQQ